MPELNYKAVLQKENVTAQDLPAKIQRKIAEYEKIQKHPFSYKKGTGDLTILAKTKLDDLNDDIIEAIYVVIDEKAEAIEAQELEAKRIAEEEAKKVAETEAEQRAREEQERIAKETAEAEAKKKEHFTTRFLGWGKK